MIHPTNTEASHTYTQHQVFHYPQETLTPQDYPLGKCLMPTVENPSAKLLTYRHLVHNSETQSAAYATPTLSNLGTSANPNYYLQIWNSTQAVWWRTQYGAAYPATLINGTSNVPNTATGDNCILVLATRCTSKRHFQACQ